MGKTPDQKAWEKAFPGLTPEQATQATRQWPKEAQRQAASAARRENGKK